MLDSLSADLFNAQTARYCSDLDVTVHSTISSTNDWCLQQCESGRKLPFACFAENQTSGKGRRGKRWIMAPGSNIALSVSWPFDFSLHNIHLLPLSIAIVLADTLSSYKLEHVGIKWPNDVYIRDKKIAGILIEAQPLRGAGMEAKNQSAVVIGVGFNFDMSSGASSADKEMQEIFSRITDMTRELKSQGIMMKIDRHDLASSLLQNIVSTCQHFDERCETVLGEFRSRYDYCDNKTVEISLDNQETLTGVARGVNDAAELLVMIDGKMHVFNSADVSVKTSL